MVLIRTSPPCDRLRDRAYSSLRRRSASASPSSSMDPSPKTAINGTPWRISSAPSSAGGSTGSIWSPPRPSTAYAHRPSACAR